MVCCVDKDVFALKKYGKNPINTLSRLYTKAIRFTLNNTIYFLKSYEFEVRLAITETHVARKRVERAVMNIQIHWFFR